MPWQNNDGNQGNQGPWGSQPAPKPAEPPAQEKPAPRKPQAGPSRRGPNAPGFGIDQRLHRTGKHLRLLLASGPGRQQAAGTVAAMLIALWLLSGFYRVESDEQGIAKVFGIARAETVGPGLHYIWPAPIGSVLIAHTGAENRMALPDARIGPPAATDPDHLMVTSDGNLADVRFTLLWKTTDLLKYEFDVQDPQGAIAAAADSAMRQTVAQTSLQSLMADGRGKVADITRDLLQKALDRYAAGVTIDGIEVQDVSVPQQVAAAMADVQKARTDVDHALGDAQAYRNSVLSQARSEAQSRLQEANAYRTEIVNRASGDAAHFKALLPGYEAARDVTLRELYLDTMEDVLAHAHKVVTDAPGGTSFVVPPPAPLPPVAGGGK